LSKEPVAGRYYASGLADCGYQSGGMEGKAHGLKTTGGCVPTRLMPCALLNGKFKKTDESMDWY